MIKKNLGSILRQYREDKNLTQEKVALEANVAYRFYQDIEGGKQQPTVETLFKLCKALQLTPEAVIMPVWALWLDEQLIDDENEGNH